MLAFYARHVAELETGVAQAYEEVQRVLRDVTGGNTQLAAEQKASLLVLKAISSPTACGLSSALLNNVMHNTY